MVGSKQNIVDFTYVENVADAHLLACDKLLTNPVVALLDAQERGMEPLLRPGDEVLIDRSIEARRETSLRDKRRGVKRNQNSTTEGCC